MTEPPAADAPDVIRRFAELVTLVSERPTAAVEQRALVRAVVDAAKQSGGTLALGEGGALLADGQPVTLPFLAKRFTRYGIDELVITGKAAVADLLDLARMLAAEPTGSDPASAFAGRAAVIDARALTLRLRPRAAPAPAAETAAPARASRSVMPGRPTRAITPLGGLALSPKQERGDGQGPPRALPIPQPKDADLGAAVSALAKAASDDELTQGLDLLVTLSDLAFRQGRHADLIEAVAALVAIEHEALERDSSDERRQLFNGALGRLTKRPMLLRQIAALRHQQVADGEATERLQAILHRYGTYGADALMDEYVSARTAEARATCVVALRSLRRTHDALLALARDTNELGARQAATILGELRDAESEAILVELLRHPEERVRRAAVAALGRFDSASSIDVLALALDDESVKVRLRAVAALNERRDPRVVTLLTTLLDRDPDTEVLHAVISAIGAVGSPDAVQLLIRTAQGEGTHPLRRNAALRIMACRALVAVRSPTSMAAVQVLRSDRDAEVREASIRLVAQAQRRSTATSVAAVAEP